MDKYEDKISKRTVTSVNAIETEVYKKTKAKNIKQISNKNLAKFLFTILVQNTKINT